MSSGMSTSQEFLHFGKLELELEVRDCGSSDGEIILFCFHYHGR
jgi:hypothetical protein